MAAPAVGAVVLIRFSFSDLSRAKLRPAVVLADATRSDFVLCQVTSNPYGDNDAIVIHDNDFANGGLRRISYARPAKLFTANDSLIENVAGYLTDEKRHKLLSAIIEVFRKGM